jgi:hypothetical protein
MVARHRWAEAATTGDGEIGHLGADQADVAMVTQKTQLSFKATWKSHIVGIHYGGKLAVAHG